MKNKIFNKLLLGIFILLSLLFFLSGCGKHMETSMHQTKTDRLSIVCTSFPQYDWTRNILGERSAEIDLILLNTKGADLHSFQPTAQNMVQIANCNLFIYVGGFSESWVDAALQSSQNPKLMSLPLLDFVNKKEEIFTEGILIKEDEHDHEEDAHEIEYDEHIWLSLNCAQDACSAIKDALCQLDPQNSKIYEENLNTYLKQLQNLDAHYRKTVENAPYRTLLFTDRFPFLYLAEDYGLTYFAAFPGCSAESEASFDTVIFLSEKLKELKLPAVCLTESGDFSFAETVINNAESENVQVQTINSMQFVTSKNINEGATYLSIMEENLQALSSALGL